MLGFGCKSQVAPDNFSISSSNIVRKEGSATIDTNLDLTLAILSVNVVTKSVC